MTLAGRQGGPWLGKLQLALLEAVLDQPERNQPEPLRDLARAWLDASPRT
jgi:hypothetical protein